MLVSNRLVLSSSSLLPSIPSTSSLLSSSESVRSPFYRLIKVIKKGRCSYKNIICKHIMHMLNLPVQCQYPIGLCRVHHICWKRFSSHLRHSTCEEKYKATFSDWMIECCRFASASDLINTIKLW